MCRISMKLSNEKSVLDAPLMRRKYQELEGTPINLVRYEFNCELGEKMEVKKEQKISTDYWSKIETVTPKPNEPDEREQLWSESRFELFEIPKDIDIEEYKFEDDLSFHNEEYLASHPFDDD